MGRKLSKKELTRIASSCRFLETTIKLPQRNNKKTKDIKKQRKKKFLDKLAIYSNEFPFAITRDVKLFLSVKITLAYLRCSSGVNNSW